MQDNVETSPHPVEVAEPEAMPEPMVGSPALTSMSDTTETDELAQLENMPDQLSNLVSPIYRFIGRFC